MGVLERYQQLRVRKGHGINTMKRKPYFITFEGPEGSGKSTQIKRIAAYLKRKNFRVLLLREPGGTAVSEAIRLILLSKHYKEMQPETELLLYLAARSQIVREKIQPALKKGWVVICDRYEDSTLSYQGYGRGLSLKMIEAMSQLVRQNIRPNRTFLLDLPTQAGFKRIGRRDRIEKQSLAFHRKVRDGFLSLARKHKKRFTVLDARQDRDCISNRIQHQIKKDLRLK